MPRKKFDGEAKITVKDDGSKNVKKLEKSFGSLARKVKSAGLAIVAALASVVVAIKLLEAAGERLGQRRALGRTLKAQGLSAKDLVRELKGLANQQIATSDIILASNRALALGIAAADLPGLLEAATKASVSLGISATVAFNDITTGVGRASPLILDNLGIVVDAVKIYKDFADSVGLSVEELTKQQKTAALSAAVMENAAKGAEDFADAQSRVTVAIATSTAGLKEWFEQTVDSIAKNDALAETIEGLSEGTSNYAAALRALRVEQDTLSEADREFIESTKLSRKEFDLLLGMLPFLHRAFQDLGAVQRLVESGQADLAENTAKITKRYVEQGEALLKALGFLETWGSAQEKAIARTKRIEAGLLKEATALDKLRAAIGEVTQAELQKELNEITLALEAARIETGGNTEAFLEMEAKVLPAIDHMKARIEGMATGLGDMGEAADDLGDKLDETADSTDRVTNSTRNATSALEREAAQANRTASSLRNLTGAEESLTLAQQRTALAKTQAERRRITGTSGDGGGTILDGGLSEFGTGGRRKLSADGNLGLA